MYRNEKIDTMLSLISNNIGQLERELKDEYKMMIRVSSDFDEIAAEFALLQRMALPQHEKEYEASTIVDRLCTQISATFGAERDTKLILEAAMAVMDENSSAAVMSRN